MIKALEQCDVIDETRKRPMMIYTDSELLINTVTKWMKTWKARGWIKADRQPVKNLDLVKQLDTLTSRRQVIMRHVRAHTNKDDFQSKWNDKADKMARKAATVSHHSKK